jgi:hypothetical protein
MPHLRDGVTVTYWPGGAEANHPERGRFRLAEAPADLLTNEKPSGCDELRRIRLEILDRRYTGWLPGLWSSAAGIIETTEERLSRRPFFFPRVARPTLPASVVWRSLSLTRLGGSHVYIEDDLDGLSVLMSGEARVMLLEPEPERRDWLATMSPEVQLLWELPNRQVDVAVIHAGPPAVTAAALGRALRVTRPGGYIAVCVRAPWEWTLYPQLEAAGLPVFSYQRAIDHWLLPCGHVVDGAGDLVILERPPNAVPPDIHTGDAERIRAQPYLSFDLDSLDETRVDEGSMHRLADRVAELAPRPEALRQVRSGADRDVLCWYDDSGSGFTAELTRNEAHLLITFLPFEAQIEYVAVCAAYELFADDATRTRPLRTRRWHEETVFG